MDKKPISVSFTGYRTQKIHLAYNSSEALTEIREEVTTVIEKLYQKGFRRFLSGMAEGFDMIAAEAVLALQKEHQDIELIAVIPFVGQELKFDAIDVFRYKKIVEKATEVVHTSQHYHPSAYYDRNDYLADNCNTLVCFYSGIKGGTGYTHKKAMKKGLEIINIFLTLDKTPNLFK